MHELSLARDMLEMIEKSLGGVRPLLNATVTIGPLSGVDPDALSFAFPEIAGEMGFGRPELIINRTRASARCADCGLEYEMDDMFVLCPACGSLSREILGGEEFTLDTVEVLGESDE